MRSLKLLQEAMREEKQRLEAALALEEGAKRTAGATTQPTGATNTHVEATSSQAAKSIAADPLDAYMTDVASQIEQDKVGLLLQPPLIGMDH